MYDLTLNSEKNYEEKKRARSLSPGGIPIQPSEAVRSLRNALREKNNAIEQLKRQLQLSEKQIQEYSEKFELAEESRQQSEKELLDEKRKVDDL